MSGSQVANSYMPMVITDDSLVDSDLSHTNPRPVKTSIHQLQLLSHPSHVVGGPLGGINTPFNGGILSRKPERIPTHGEQNIASLQGMIASYDIGNGIYPKMP